MTRAAVTGPTRPVLFVTNHVPPERAGAFAALHEREPLELALFGGRSHHATAGLEDPGVPYRRIDERAVHGLAASVRYRAVVCGTAGRVALPAAWLGARRAGTPFLLWSALWGELVTPAHVAARPLMAAIYRSADAVVAYGEHVAAFARRHGARRVHIAPQAVDNAWWGEGAAPAGGGPLHAVFAGRDAPEKGRDVLLDAWRSSGLGGAGATLVLAGGDGGAAERADGAERAGGAGAAAPAGGVRAVGAIAPEELRNLHRAANVLVMPSIASRRFREPWGLVANEAMNQHLAIVASDAVGAAAGGLVRDARNALVVPAGDAVALAGALRRLHEDPALRASLGDHGAADVQAFSFAAWADGFAGALLASTAGPDGDRARARPPHRP
jgi:glycosyltransferase involved in cell wall biosynthesis